MAMASRNLVASCIFVLLCFGPLVSGWKNKNYYISAIGDPGMKRDGLRVAIESWNQCNEVGEEAPGMGSPRAADCFDIDYYSKPVKLIHKVDETINKLGIANATQFGPKNADLYAAWKEIFLGSKCLVPDFPHPWHFWMIMLKSGNMDTMAAACPKNGKPSKPFPDPSSRFPCFGKGCMNMPLMYHDYTGLVRGEGGSLGMRGSFYGTWDLDADVQEGEPDGGVSYYKVTWEKKAMGEGGWVFHHKLRTSAKYPWLMLYLRSDATWGFSGGYHYETRGMSKIIPRSPNFTVKFRLEVKQGGGPASQFYLMDMGGCWKNDGRPCDGDTATDVTRYSEMIINPETKPWCSPASLRYCPPHHTFPNGTRVRRNDTARFPYDAYHIHCSPGNAAHLDPPYDLCDPYSNPQAQEILQILPHPVWGPYGYPTRKGVGWVGDPRSWELDVGALSRDLYFYQDPGTVPAERFWPSIDLGTEVYKSNDSVAEWTVSDFDIIISKNWM